MMSPHCDPALERSPILFLSAFLAFCLAISIWWSIQHVSELKLILSKVKEILVIVIPVFTGVLLILAIVAWIGYIVATFRSNSNS